MPLTCPVCGSYGSLERLSDSTVCRQCGATTPRGQDAVLIITGAAAAGKSTICGALADDPRLLALDGDVLASGASAVSDGRRDYEAFWRYLLLIAAEVHDNGLVPAYGCVCLPSQVLAEPLPSATLHFLALVSDEQTVRRRITDRSDASPTIDLAVHAAIDAQLRQSTVPPPHTFATLDTRELTRAQTIAAGVEWASSTLSA
jgi:hypothetical protein